MMLQKFLCIVLSIFDREEHSNMNKRSIQGGIRVRTDVSAGSSDPALAVTGWDDVKGAGDIVWIFTHGTGLYLLADGYTALTGKDCGCDGRQRWLNERFPIK
jgi:hypothetical protein